MHMAKRGVQDGPLYTVMGLYMNEVFLILWINQLLLFPKVIVNTRLLLEFIYLFYLFCFICVILLLIILFSDSFTQIGWCFETD